MDSLDKRLEENGGEKEKEDPTPSPDIREISPPPPPLAEEPQVKKPKRHTVIKARIPAFLAFAMCWPTNVEIRKGGPEPKHLDAGLYVVKKSAGGRRNGKTYIVPASEKSSRKAESSLRRHPPSPVTIHNEQHLHQHWQTEQKQQGIKQEKEEEEKVEEKIKADRIKELELELKILGQNLDRDELYTIPESGTDQSVKRQSPYRIAVPGRYCGEIVYEEHDEFDYVIRSPRVKFAD